MECIYLDGCNNFEQVWPSSMVLSVITLWSSVIGTSVKGGAVSVAVAEGVSAGLYGDQMKPHVQFGCSHFRSCATASCHAHTIFRLVLRVTL